MKHFIFVIFFISLHQSSHEQIVNIENQRIQNDTIHKVFNLESAFSSQRNNDLTLTEWHAACVSQIKSKNAKDMLLVLLNNDKSVTDNTVMNNASLLHFRCSHKIHPRIKLEAFYQIQANELLALRQRQLFGSGFRFKVFDASSIKIYLGSLYMHELESTDIKRATTSYERCSNYLVVSGKLDHSQIEFSNVMYYQPLISNFNDFRFTEQFGMNVPISKHLNLTTTLSSYLDTSPPEGIAKYSYAISQGIRFSL